MKSLAMTLRIFLQIFLLSTLWLTMLTTPAASTSGTPYSEENARGPEPQAGTDQIIELSNPGNHTDIQPSLQAAVDAASDGDTIVLPAGEFYIDRMTYINKFISIRGRGSGEGGTKLYRRESLPDSTLIEWEYRYMLYYECNSDTPSNIVISDIYFKGKRPHVEDGDGGSEAGDIGVKLIQCLDFVITGNRFEHFGSAAIIIEHKDARAGGLIYNNSFIDNVKRTSTELGSTFGYGIAVGGEDEVWVESPQFGTDNFVFIEDNYFSGNRHDVAGAGGGLYVFRHNEVAHKHRDHAVDAHGGGGIGSPIYGNEHSTRAYEVYDNYIYATAFGDGAPITEPPADVCDYQTGLIRNAMAFRGGEGLVHDNRIEGFKRGIKASIEMGLEEGDYPVYAQIGYKSGVVQGPDHSGTDLPEGDGDLFEWGNDFVPYSEAECIKAFVTSEDEPRLLKNGRDYHLGIQKPGYSPYTYPHPLRELYSPIFTPTPTFTSTPTPTATNTPTPTYTPSPTATSTPLPTNTPTLIPTNTPLPTYTPTPTNTPTPVLAISKSASPDPVVAGEKLTYIITITNTQNTALTGVVVRDMVPEHTTFSSVNSHGGQWIMRSPGKGKRGEVSWEAVEPLLPGQTAYLEMVVQVEQGAGGLVVNADYGATMEGGDGPVIGQPVWTHVVQPTPTTTPTNTPTPVPPTATPTPTTTPTNTPTPVLPTATPTPTYTPPPAPTDTPAPTNTPLPTDTPTLTPTTIPTPDATVTATFVELSIDEPLFAGATVVRGNGIPGALVIVRDLDDLRIVASRSVNNEGRYEIDLTSVLQAYQLGGLEAGHRIQAGSDGQTYQAIVQPQTVQVFLPFISKE